MIATIKRIGLRCAFYKLLSRLNPNDKEITSACDRIGAYKYLLRYRYVLDKLSSSQYNRTDRRQTKVWVCWLQGYDKAPHIVKRCIDSIRQHSRGLDTVVIDNTNIHDYITVPRHISEKYEKGIIPNAHYSDYIRVSLLALHGGIWIDSTVLLTDSLPDRIVDTDLFCFKLQSIGKAYASNWFIASAVQHPFLVQMRALLEEYWLREDRLVSYSIFHLFWAMVADYNDFNRRLWADVPYFADINCKILQMELFADYSTRRLDEIKAISPIHKLTYKFGESDQNRPNTFYDKIFNNR